MKLTSHDTAVTDIAITILGENAVFYETEGGFPGLILDGKDIGRVGAYRMFPLSRTNTYISLMDKDKKEVGMLLTLEGLPEASRLLLEKELARRYFIPEVIKITDIKEEFNYTFFTVETDAGKREFTVFDMNASLVNLGKGSVMISDIDGNKYLIHDIYHKGKKAQRFLEIWL